MLLLITFLLSCNSPSKIKDSNIAETAESYTFPDDWLGRWKGTLDIYKAGEKTMEVEMRLINELTPDSTRLKWGIIYGEDTIKGLRDYALLIDTVRDNHYVVDEANSILLDGYVHDNIYMSIFEVMGSRLSSTYRLENRDQLSFEITMYPNEPVSISGGIVIDGDTIPEVKSYNLTTYQKATLTRY